MEFIGQQQPAYRADFYCPENIVGYTGSLHDKPTVYFYNGDEFGHITQAYDDDRNVGREEVQSNPAPGWNWHIENRVRNGVQKAYEFSRGPEGEEIHFHSSRTVYVDCSRANINVFAILSQAIWLLTHKKELPRRGLGNWYN